MCGGVSAVACPPPDGVTHYFIDLIIRFSSFIVRFLIIFWLLLFELDYLRDALVRSHACAHACVRPRAHAPHTRCLSVSQVSVTSNYIANLSGLRPHGHDDDMRCRLPCGGAIQSQHLCLHRRHGSHSRVRTTTVLDRSWSIHSICGADSPPVQYTPGSSATARSLLHAQWLSQPKGRPTRGIGKHP
jgi:hypothetical protein